MANVGSTKPTYSDLEIMLRVTREAIGKLRELLGVDTESNVVVPYHHVKSRLEDLEEAKAELDTIGRLLGNEELPTVLSNRDDLRSELARVRGLLQRQWISVEERLPEVGGTYLVTYQCALLDETAVAFGYFIIFEDGGKWSRTGVWPDPKAAVAHWMEVPKRLKFACLVDAFLCKHFGEYDRGEHPDADELFDLCLDLSGVAARKLDAVAGSAETGGEKAAPLPNLSDHCDDCGHVRAKHGYGAIGYNAASNCTLDDCDCPWWLEPNFRRSSQNQTVSGGVEGAHEGTTADENGSREPEKLNNAHPEEFCDCCGARLVPDSGQGEGICPNCDLPTGFSRSALAESSLSSPPPADFCKKCGEHMTSLVHQSKLIYENRGHYFEPAASPELLPTQLPIAKHPLTPEPQSTQLDTGKEK